MADREYQRLSKSLKSDLVGRYAYYNKEQDNIGMAVTYFVEEYKPARCEVVFRRLFDPNGILLEHSPLSAQNKITVDADAALTDFFLYESSEEKFIKQQMMVRQRDYMFYIKYQRVVIPGEEEGEDPIVECLPQEIRKGDGSEININHYDIRVNPSLDGKAILGIINKRYGPIKYHEVNVDVECGYVQGSIVKIYSTEHASDMLNIVHIHVNDMSDQVTLEVAYMADGETLAAYQEFKEDFSGRTLRYKVLVREQRIHRVLYN